MRTALLYTGMYKVLWNLRYSFCLGGDIRSGVLNIEEFTKQKMGDEAFLAKGRSIRVGKLKVCMETSEQPPGSCMREMGSRGKAAKRS